MLPESIVQKQVDYYNNHNLEGFLSMYDECIEIFTINSFSAELKGLDSLRKRYIERFSNPKLHAYIKNRIVKDKFVIDAEQVEGIYDYIVNVIAIYEVNDNKIIKVTFIR